MLRPAARRYARTSLTRCGLCTRAGRNESTVSADQNGSWQWWQASTDRSTWSEAAVLRLRRGGGHLGSVVDGGFLTPLSLSYILSHEGHIIPLICTSFFIIHLLKWMK